MFDGVDFTSLRLPPEARRWREDIRAFVKAERAAGTFVPVLMHADFNAEFTRRLGARGWIGMTWPKRYGGGERSYLERFVVTEEMLALGAPRAAHSVGDRQVGPALLRHGSELQRQRFLPAMARGEYWFTTAMSEPGAGSDLSAIETRAEKVPGGWRLNGLKSWISWAHKANAMVLLARSEPRGENRHAGMSQFIVEFDTPGVSQRPVLFPNGRHHYNEVRLENAFVPDELLLGAAGEGWKQMNSELLLERSGPERYMTAVPLLSALLARLARDEPAGGGVAETLGRLAASLSSLRRMALAIALSLEPRPGANAKPALDLEASLVRDMSTFFEHDVIEAARTLVASEPITSTSDEFLRLLAETIVCSPIASIGGGTTEVLRNGIARRLLGKLA